MQTARLSERTAFLGQVDVVPQGGDRRLTAWGLDVSETGMFLQTPQLMAVGDALSLRFTVEDTEVHVRAAEVVRQRPLAAVNVDGRVAGMAIRFVSIDPASRTALRRLVQRGSAAGGVMATVDSVLPAPTSTLPPLTRSIIETVVGRDLDDTQDLLPPATTRRAPTAAVTMSMLPFTSLDVSLPPDEPNLSAESRVFGGVPDAPRAVTMGPRPRSRPPTTAPMGSVSMPPRAERPVQVTQPLFTLPPIDVVEGLAPSVLPESTVTAATTSNAAQPNAVDDGSASNAFNNWRFAPWASGPPAPRANDDVDSATVDTAAVDAVAVDAAAVDAVVQRAMHVRFDDERPVIDNPSVLESVTVPPAALVEDSGSYSLGDLPGSSSTPPTLGAQASSRGLDEGLAIRHLPLARERQASRAGGHQPRRSWGMATAVLLAGCAAGAVVGLMQGADRRHASGEPPPSMIAATVAIGHPEPATTVPAATVPAPRSVAQAEQELREPVAAAIVTTAVPAPLTPPVAAVEAVEVVEAKATATATATAPPAPLLPPPFSPASLLRLLLSPPPLRPIFPRAQTRRFPSSQRSQRTEKRPSSKRPPSGESCGKQRSDGPRTKKKKRRRRKRRRKKRRRRMLCPRPSRQWRSPSRPPSSLPPAAPPRSSPKLPWPLPRVLLPLGFRPLLSLPLAPLLRRRRLRRLLHLRLPLLLQVLLLLLSPSLLPLPSCASRRWSSRSSRGCSAPCSASSAGAGWAPRGAAAARPRGPQEPRQPRRPLPLPPPSPPPRGPPPNTSSPPTGRGRRIRRGVPACCPRCLGSPGAGGGPRARPGSAAPAASPRPRSRRWCSRQRPRRRGRRRPRAASGRGPPQRPSFLLGTPRSFGRWFEMVVVSRER